MALGFEVSKFQIQTLKKNSKKIPGGHQCCALLKIKYIVFGLSKKNNIIKGKNLSFSALFYHCSLTTKSLFVILPSPKYNIVSFEKLHTNIILPPF
jgi:hypothetical protein